MSRSTLLKGGTIMFALLFAAVAAVSTPMVFADQGTCSSNSGGECASNNESNGNPSKSATPEVPAGKNPQPNPQRRN